MSRSNKKLSARSVPFQSDIVIDLNGEVVVSFLPEALSRDAPVFELRSWSARPAQEFPQSLRAQYQACNLCPISCGFDRTAKLHPRCGDWNLRVSNTGVSFGDEPELSRGGGSGVMFLSGCSLKCPSCINPEKVREGGHQTSVSDFLQMAQDLYSRGANNLQILSPTVHFPHLRYVLGILKQQNFPLPIVLKSSGYELPEQIQQMKGLVDVWVPDYKFSDSKFWQERSGARDYQQHFERALEVMHAQVGDVAKDPQGRLVSGVMVRHVKNPYLSAEEQERVLSFLKKLPNGIAVSILDNFVVLE